MKTSKETLIAAISLGAIFFYLVTFSPYPLYLALIFGGIPLLYDLLKELFKFNFSQDLLAGVSIVTAILLEQYLAGTLVILMLSGGKSIEAYAVRTASKVLEALAKRAPSRAHLKEPMGQMKEIAVSQIAIGDELIIFPHEICPVDGEVVLGSGIMDESYLTGEPFMIAKVVGSEVLSGAVNGDESITIKASKLPIDSRYEKIIQVMRDTESKRPQMRRLADKLGAFYTPLALAIAFLAWVLTQDPVRFLAVLVVATPCPLLIAVPVAIIGSISLSASRGILIKNPIVLEQLDQCKTMIFDKTGTLTYGAPSLTDIFVFGDYKKNEVLSLVASLEQYSKHPLSSAILKRAKEEALPLQEVLKISETKGQGLKGLIDHHEVIVTSRKKIEDASLLPEGAGLECVILVDGKLAALFRFHDDPRSDSKSFIHHLVPKHGFKKLLIISGDRDVEVGYLARQVGIKEVYSGMSPEEKVQIVQKETKLAKTAYLGDGINDAPALMVATCGIAFGQNSDITAEAASAVIMDSSLEKVDEFIHISSRMRRIALQSALGGMALSLVGMLFAAFGFLTPVAGAIFQEVIDVCAIMNSLRTIWRPKILSDIDAKI